MIEAEIKEKPRFPKIWFLPILAICLGIGMIFNHWNNKGYNIVISFKTAEGLEANKTKVKFKNVDIGMVKEIHFNDDASHVLLKIIIDKPMGKFLKEDTSFWVVKPRVGVGGVSGLGTLLSGSYIELSPGDSKVKGSRFVGLEQPPITQADVEGMRLKLVSKGGKTLKPGSPINFRGINVGKVEKFFIESQKRITRYDIFVRSPYDQLVTTNTLFWNSGGISVNAGSRGLNIEIDTLESLISGGISFDVLDDELGKPLKDAKEFILYKNKDSAKNRREYKFLEYVLLATDSISGLRKGAPVEYRGIQIGIVSNPAMNFLESGEIRTKYGLPDDGKIPIMVKLQPGRIAIELEQEIEDFQERFEDWIQRGMKASLKSSSLLTGELKISLDLTSKRLSEIQNFGPYSVIPIEKGGLQGQVSDVLKKIKNLPLERTLNDLGAVLRGFKPGSDVYTGLEASMDKLQKTLDDAQPVLKSLGNNPSSLIFGNQKGQDIIPKAQGK